LKILKSHGLIFLALLILFSFSAKPATGQIETPPINLPNDVLSNIIHLPLVLRTNTVTQPVGNIVVDHTSIALFDQIPERYLTAARNMRLLFSDRSVGQNINEALECMASPSWVNSPSACRVDYYTSAWDYRVFNSTDLQNGTVPARIYFPASSTIYDRSNWTFEFRGGSWSDLTQDFIESLAPSYISSKDVLTYQFSYLNVDEFSDIADPNTGFFSNNPNKYDIYDLEAYIARNPNKIFFFWTTSLARGIGTQAATTFNNQMRQYAANNHKILFDVADIESHTDQGIPCYDNRDGIQYCTPSGNCENYPDDRVNYLAICQDYTTEVNGGHLGSVSAGKIQIAKGFWVLMARIAGWDGVSQ
jgi:hypothetical protein